MSVMRGYATIKGISDGGCTVEMGGYLSVFIDTLPIQVTSDLVEQMGAHGEGVCAQEWSNHRIILDATFRPAAASRAGLAQPTTVMLPGDHLTLSGFEQVKVFGEQLIGYADPRADDILNGDWILVGPDAGLTLNTGSPGEAHLTLGFYFGRHAALTLIT